MNSLSITKNGPVIVLSGVLDENSDLKEMAGTNGNVVINFKGITRVNSCGVREWINALKLLQATKIIYQECPMIIVKQINAVPDFCGKAKIYNFFAPYYCESCDEEAIQLILASAVKLSKPPELNCPKCAKHLIFDAIPNQYFDFLKRN